MIRSSAVLHRPAPLSARCRARIAASTSVSVAPGHTQLARTPLAERLGEGLGHGGDPRLQRAVRHLVGLRRADRVGGRRDDGSATRCQQDRHRGPARPRDREQHVLERRGPVVVGGVEQVRWPCMPSPVVTAIPAGRRAPPPPRHARLGRTGFVEVAGERHDPAAARRRELGRRRLARSVRRPAIATWAPSAARRPRRGQRPCRRCRRRSGSRGPRRRGPSPASAGELMPGGARSGAGR